MKICMNYKMKFTCMTVPLEVLFYIYKSPNYLVTIVLLSKMSVFGVRLRRLRCTYARNPGYN
jgi:hypothetical protein